MTQKPTIFTFEEYAFDAATRTATFTYRLHGGGAPERIFTERLVFGGAAAAADIPAELLDAALRMVHLTLGVSYYKAYCPRTITLTYPLSAAQAQYWNTVYTQGLGEFFFRNAIDPRGRVQFPATENYTPPKAVPFARRDRALLGIGGGKDSLVSKVLLDEHGDDYAYYVLETGKAYDVVDAVIAQDPSHATVRVRRELDAQIADPDTLPGAYQGHIPISAVYGAVGVLASLLYDYRWVIVSNEHSANSGNTVHHGVAVNHQWSKSAAFEQMFQDYVRRYVTPDVRYFSLLRPFHELRIVQMFVERASRYLPHFASCNRNFSSTRPNGTVVRWCGACPKCAAAFLLFAAHVPREELTAIFGRNLLADASLVPLYRDLLGYGTHKPFDCVGTFEESRVALAMARDAYAGDVVVETFAPQLGDMRAARARVFGTAPSPTVPSRWVLYGMHTVLLLGYGVEGRATHAYLQKHFPALAVQTADRATDGDDYLARQDDADIVVKTPGIPRALLHAHMTTATNLFFAEVKGRAPIIGVTGTKGKSTTASLIYAMLTAAGKDARLVGNIGTPMLAALDSAPLPTEDTIWVVELSSYQLETLGEAPDTAVFLNLFPEHMDHHGSVDAYYAAKARIVHNQCARDMLVYNADDARVAALARESLATVQAFAPVPAPVRDALTLPGEHNVSNVRAAWTVAAHYGVTPDAAARAVATFTPLPHRLARVATISGVTFYDDAIATTPESVIAALRALGNVDTLIVGGQDRGYDYAALNAVLAECGVRAVVQLPDTGVRVTPPPGAAVLQTTNLDEAVRFALSHTRPGHSCLFSPGAPSYNLWKNFAARGEAFTTAVHKAQDDH